MWRAKLDEIINMWPRWVWIGNICLILLGLWVIIFG